MRRWLQTFAVSIAIATLLLTVLAGPGVSLARASPATVAPSLGVVARIPIPAAEGAPGTFAWGPVYDPDNGVVYVELAPAVLGNYSLYAISGANDSIVSTVALETTDVAPPTPDPTNGHLYISTGGSFGPGSRGWNETVISGDTNTLLRKVPVCADAGIPVLDPGNGKLYVPCPYQLSVISTTNDSLVTTLDTLSAATLATYSNLSGEMYIPSGSNLTVFSPANSTMGPTIFLRPANAESSIQGMFFDAADGDLYVSLGNGLLDIVSTLTNRLVGSLPGVGPAELVGPGGVVDAFEFGNRSTNVSVISPVTNGLVAHFRLPSMNGFAYDAGSGHLYAVSAIGDGTVYEITMVTGATLASLTVGTPLVEYPVYDPGNGDVYLQDWTPFSTSILVIGATTPSSTGPFVESTFLEGVGAGLLIAGATGTGALVVLRRRDRRRKSGSLDRSAGSSDRVGSGR